MENPEETTSEVSSVDVEEAPKFKTLAEAQAAYEDLNAASHDLLDDANAQIASLEKENEELKAENDALENLGKDLDAKCGEFEKQIDALKVEQKTVEAKAAQLVAATGTEPAEIETDEPAQKSEADLWAEYHSIESSQERRAFYLANLKKG